MISSQRDTLFVMADALEEEYPSFAREVRRAADTIWELRNKLAGTVDQSERITELEEENASLRSCLSDDAENARQIMGESAKLRKLVRDTCDLLPHADWSSTECDDRASAYIDQAIELGIEEES